MRRWLCLYLCAAGWTAAQAWEERLTREGAFWLRTVRGAEDVPARGELRVSASGRVSLRGAPSAAAATYSFTIRVKAQTEEEARRLLGQPLVRTGRLHDVTLIEVIHGGIQTSAELTVHAPETLRAVRVETRGGAVEVAGFEGSAHLRTGGGRIRIDRVGGDVSARSAGGEISLGAIGGAAHCVSAGGEIRAGQIGGAGRFETAGGDIAIREVRGPVTASTAGGGIQIQRAGASVEANTAGGEIRVGAAQGPVVAHTMGGPIFVGPAAGVRCESGGGAIELVDAAGAVHATTVVGSIVARLARAAALEESSLTTGSGDITLWVPPSLGLLIQAQNRVAGGERIVSEFPDLTIRRRGSLVIAEGLINGGGPLLRLAGAGGTIYIKRQR
jgi:DUF4097 and DUF4098 domain-containing protein YvlB